MQLLVFDFQLFLISFETSGSESCFWYDARSSIRYGHSNEKYLDTKEQIDEFLALKEVVLLYAGNTQACQRAIERFKAACVEIVVVRSKAVKEEPEDLELIERNAGEIA